MTVARAPFVGRRVAAPVSLEDAFDLTRRAFDPAYRFQMPVVILTDQFLMGSCWNIPALAVNELGSSQYLRTGNLHTAADNSTREYDIATGNPMGATRTSLTGATSWDNFDLD